MEIDQLVDRACERAGSDDLGPETWREGLEVLVRSLNTESALNEMGDGVMADQIVDHLVNRLEVEQWYARYPEIDDQEIGSPLFGLGLPRTGSTALSFLLAQDTSRRSLRTWEASKPCPPPETATEHTDPRIAAAQVGIDFTLEMFPDFAGMLPTSATGPQECLLLMCLDFRSQMFEAMARIPSYSSWLLQCDMVPTYRYHERMLKLLQWRCPPQRWWLKSPAHMHSIDALDEVYPDARFVMTHRDVGKVLPSVCALYDTLSNILTERPDPAAIGRQNLETWRTSLERLIDFRDRGNEDRFHDLSFAAVQHDPMAEVEQLYAALGDELGHDARQRMADWWAESSKERSGPHHHRAEDYGLDSAAIREQFAFYSDRFDVPVEDAGES
jgi:Sulfotransferase family